MRKRGQAAVEFLMTYGWAILIVLIALGVLSYFGVFQERFLPSKCLVEPGISCEDFRVREDSVTLKLKNVQGKTMTIESIEVEHCSGTNSGTLENDEEGIFIIDGCANIADEKFKAEVSITYSLTGGLSRKKKGNILSRIEEGGLVGESLEWITTTKLEFDEGIYSQTKSIAEGSVELNSAQSLGTYESKIFDAGSITSWDNISWGEPILYKEHVTPDGTNCGDSSIKGMWYLEESSGDVIDSSYCNKNGNNQGATPDRAGKIEKSYEFDGSNYVNMDQRIFDSAPDELTGMAWVYPRAIGIIAYWQGWGGQFYIGIGGGGEAVMGVKQTRYNCGDYNGNWHHFISSKVYPLDTWYHLAGVYDKSANTIRIFVNGVSDGDMDSPLNPDECLSDPSTYHPPTIGAATITGGGYGSNYFNGFIDEAIVYNKALSQPEILDHYKQGVLDLQVQVRSCDNPSCEGEEFSSQSFTDSSTQDLAVSNNRYFQYKVNFDSEDTAYTPILEDVTVGYTKYS